MASALIGFGALLERKYRPAESAAARVRIDRLCTHPNTSRLTRVMCREEVPA
jgi:hypothetical protein